MEATLLVELLTEELPPKSLAKLGRAFASGIRQSLIDALLVAPEAKWAWYATPRRLAVLIHEVADQQAPRLVTDKIMPVSVAFDSEGKPTSALLKKLQAKRFRVEDIPAFERRMDGKTETLFFQWTDPGFALEQVLADHVTDAVSNLPISRVMRWGAGEAEFVRPVHGLVTLHGKRVIPGSVLGVSAGNTTSGHRFLGAASIRLANAEEYEEKLRKDGHVIADFAVRRSEIENQLQAEAKRQNANLGAYQDLLDEVTALVEFPAIYTGEFDAAFLEVPQECLILTMRQNQKYFPLFNTVGKLLPKFLIVSNMKVAQPRHIIGGNERVVRPRLEDARFFFNQDRKIKLDKRVNQLEKVVYHNKLGNQLERVRRIQRLAEMISRELGADVVLAKRAAWLSKADLLTGMVGEFPELQGTMGRYYALHDGEPKAVADAIGEHYCPRFAGDRLPEGLVACSVALADKLDVLVGMFGVMEQPTGEKDPFGLRRTGLGVVRILIEQSIPLKLDLLIADADATFTPRLPRTNTVEAVFLFILERVRGYLREKGFSALEVEAVLPQQPEAAFDEHAVQRESRLDLLLRRIEAVREFQKLPEAEHLAAANKRIRNILRQSNFSFDGVADPNMFENAAERELYKETVNVRAAVEFNFSARAYKESLFALASLRPCVDRFFDNVLVNADDPKTRENRLRLLGELAHMMNRVADISKLAQ